MAKDKPSTKKAAKPAATAKVTRIKASDEAPARVKKEKVAKATEPEAAPAKKRGKTLRAIGGYFKGAWVELSQVRWPTRKATWEMTAAVLLFTAFFVALIIALDSLFEYLLELMIG